MEFQQLEMFTALVDESSLSRAAHRVCRTPAAVSTAVRKLEQELGVSLFDRSERNLHQLTPAGKLLYSHATRILEMKRVATTSVKDLILGNTGVLRLGTHESVSLYVLPALLHKFNEANPELKTEILCGPSELLIPALRSGAVELALIADAPADPSFDRQAIMQDQLVLITHPRHRLSSVGVVQVRDLANEFLLVQGTKSQIRERIVQALKDSGTPFRLGAQNVAIEAIKRMVAEGRGIGFVPLMCVREELASGQVTMLRVADVQSQWELSLIRLRDQRLSPAARSFLKVSHNAGQSEEASAESIAEHQKSTPIRTNSRRAFMVKPRKVIHC